MTRSVLDEIVAATERELNQRAREGGAERRSAQLSSTLDALPPTNSLAASIRACRSRNQLAVIAEVKRRSPSAGTIATDVDPAVQAARYISGGCAAISVLTNGTHFGGSLDDLAAVRGITTTVPLLRKDFIIHESQLLEARCAGADAVLLIERVLSSTPGLLSELHAKAAELGLEALVEVDSREGLIAAIEAGAVIVGVNNRDLATFGVDLARTEEIASHVPDSCILVAESGIETVVDAHRMREAGARAVLVGSALMRADDAADLVRSLGAA